MAPVLQARRPVEECLSGSTMVPAVVSVRVVMAD
jgi:hypothetical protein